MKPAVMFTLALGLGVASAPALASEVQERFREQNKQIDLTTFLKGDNDARSQSFLYGGTHAHAFTVEKDGTYVLASHVPGGESEDYRIAARLLDDSGDVIASGKGLGNAGGLDMSQRLPAGDYTLEVEGHKFGSSRQGGNSYYVTVERVDVDGGVSRGDGLSFSGDDDKTAVVRRSDAVAAIAPPAVDADSRQASQDSRPQASGANGTSPADTAARQETAETSAPEPAARPDNKPDSQRSFEELVKDVKIRASGEVMSFEVLEQGTVEVSTSTFPGNEGSYRIEAEVVSGQGQVVARDAGKGFDGDVDLRSELEPGEYRVRVKGQKFGGAGSGVNNYELKVRQLD